MLSDLGATRIRLITDDPAEYGGLHGYGRTIVGRVGLPVVETPHDVRHLRAKRDRMEHAVEVSPTRPDSSQQQR